MSSNQNESVAPPEVVVPCQAEGGRTVLVRVDPHTDDAPPPTWADDDWE